MPSVPALRPRSSSDQTTCCWYLLQHNVVIRRSFSRVVTPAAVNVLVSRVPAAQAVSVRVPAPQPRSSVPLPPSFRSASLPCMSASGRSSVTRSFSICAATVESLLAEHTDSAFTSPMMRPVQKRSESPLKIDQDNCLSSPLCPQAG